MLNPGRIRVLSATMLLALIACVLAWQMRKGISMERAPLALALTIPLWLPLRGLVLGHRRTYAWATLCVIPYFILGITEAVANPLQRGWAAICLGLALTLFSLLIGYLRLTRTAAERQGEPRREE